ncbi:hypothetical protein BDK51DRAFT_37429 [Blyttiomyces helicus]|uniref:Uncharacterized protein n=1 Tax=Blyttiomyces helicus TaxID=388810 RepID=A0A4P9W4C1_9FUNG|nr:hypothetical protein BDK51DRAFT_37429 [Blyttiomyces helicus]|eukprot:RKO85530.1 hypothetical protein BDK51DRAFT_37429 [Blyttiomyces helicus]
MARLISPDYDPGLKPGFATSDPLYFPSNHSRDVAAARLSPPPQTPQNPYHTHNARPISFAPPVIHFEGDSDDDSDIPETDADPDARGGKRKWRATKLITCQERRRKSPRGANPQCLVEDESSESDAELVPEIPFCANANRWTERWGRRLVSAGHGSESASEHCPNGRDLLSPSPFLPPVASSPGTRVIQFGEGVSEFRSTRAFGDNG